ncbi:PTS transporter subunit IIABC [Mycoplasmopsis synoviae]|uniref:PTS transporter subunit IIABC n=1 Tax=Mycoplasmopsis synoviae TaxID=2109 RepID=UPI001CE1B56A|nr:PTS transporter subunit IIABC [Mycoplasmopsis synoviae]UBX97827.1 glucose PTS transporter subunit IIA [Mycoplasmopsis synoviae]UBX98799.1 glucose PTS transporter subunit IIA [Mycoplasmopsis synoviae]UBX99448.1 glucose PTS transporter subunit IIA [Mycoplasmopsis synoviae]UBX99789.1 glucose PTS transporter subunit IIA [Mycoplasmopsis synoviae]
MSIAKLGSFFRSKKEKNSDNSGSGNVRKILSKLSGAFMLPISVMAIAGLFLGVGATVAEKAAGVAAVQKIGELLKILGDPVFGALPLLFAAAFVIAFTDEAGVAVFAAIIGYLVFSAVQGVFITPVTSTVNGKEDIDGYVVLFEQGGRSAKSLKQLVGSTLGIRSLQTSVFGGIVVGLVVQYLYNKFHTIQLPRVISFFGGKRFVSLVTIPAMAVLAFVFLLFWPWVGIALNFLGEALNKTPVGVNSLIFGYIERSLIPFGLHHVFYAPVWYTPAGGDLNEALKAFVSTNSLPLDLSLEGAQGAVAAAGVSEGYANFVKLFQDAAKEPNGFQGDSVMSLKLLGYGNTVALFSPTELVALKNPSSTIPTTLSWVGKTTSQQVTVAGKTYYLYSNVPLFAFVQYALNIKVGQYLDGKFGVMMLALPAAAAAMIFAAPKENRKVAAGTVVPAAFTSLITGVTEPIEFTFLFLSPLLFWGFHSIMAAFSFMFANLLNVHIPMAFSGGILDFVIYGVIPFQKGTQFWFPLLTGAAYMPVYFFVFYFWIKYKNLETPGRGGNTKLFTRKDYEAKKDAKHSAEGMTSAKTVDPQAYAVVQAYGGTENITAYNNCASRLRYDVKDVRKINPEALKAAGAVAVKFEGSNHAQGIFGPVAEQLNSKIKSQRDLIAAKEAEEKASSVRKLNQAPVVEKEVVKKETPVKKTTVQQLTKPVSLYTPARGDLKPLEYLNDGVFSNKTMGDGFVVRFVSEKVGNVYSPVDGVVTLVFPTKHAYGIETKEGVKLLVHIGIDTVNLNGQGFESFVRLGQKVKAGDQLAKVDLPFLKRHKVKSDVITLVLPESKYKNFSVTLDTNEVPKLGIRVGLVR